MSFTIYVNGIAILNQKVINFSPDGKIRSVSDLTNILAFIGSLTETATGVEIQLDSLLSKLEDLKDQVNDEHHAKFDFLLEQFTLLKDSKKRRYSSNLMTTAILWQNISPCLYKRMLADNLLTLPCISHLKNQSSGLNVESGLEQSSIDYLQKRFDSLNERGRLVSLSFDEIYTAKQCEYQSGQFYGMEEGAPTKTILAWMINGVASSYSDVCCLVPLVKIDATIIRDWFFRILEVIMC